MSFNPEIQSRQYQVATTVYEGPLDLLLQLIERAELDITKLSLAQVTDQYLGHIRHLDNRVMEDVSAFIVIGSRLIQIKSEALLPRPIQREQGEEDPGEALAMQLIAYKRYRQIADLLAYKEETGLRSHLRLAPVPQFEAKLDLTGIGLADLLSAAQSVFFQARQKSSLDTVVTRPRITIREKIQQISRLLRSQNFISFTSLISKTNTKLDIVVTFLALLELIKLRLVEAEQEKQFGNISIKSITTWDFEDEIETEFGE